MTEAWPMVVNGKDVIFPARVAGVRTEPGARVALAGQA